MIVLEYNRNIRNVVLHQFLCVIVYVYLFIVVNFQFQIVLLVRNWHVFYYEPDFLLFFVLPVHCRDDKAVDVDVECFLKDIESAVGGVGQNFDDGSDGRSTSSEMDFGEAFYLLSVKSYKEAFHLLIF